MLEFMSHVPISELLKIGGGSGIGLVVVFAYFYFRYALKEIGKRIDLLDKKMEVYDASLETIRVEISAVKADITHIKDTRPSKDELNETLGAMKVDIATILERTRPRNGD